MSTNPKAAGLSPQARRLRTIIVTVPVIGVTALVLYKRLILGEPRRTLPTDLKAHGHEKVVPIYVAGANAKEERGRSSTS